MPSVNRHEPTDDEIVRDLKRFIKGEQMKFHPFELVESPATSNVIMLFPTVKRDA